MTDITQEWVQSCLPVRDRDTHKGDYGKVHILAGSKGFTGAPWFASEAAVRTGSGLVFLHVPEEIWPVAAVKCREAMPAPIPPYPVLLDKMNGADCVLIGPGLGRSRAADVRTRHLIEQVKAPLVLDADGLNALSEHMDSLDARKGSVTVLTPHDGEMMRLLGTSAPIENREETARSFAVRYGCILVLKGHRTLTALPDGTVYRNTTGNPGMAKGGSGDVLAGIITSLIGQGIPPEKAVPAAVWIHGRAGDLSAEQYGEYSMAPSDMLTQLGNVLKNGW